MPHERKRHLLDAFQKICAHSPIVGLFGHRQVGKTTFLLRHSNEYFSLDESPTLEQAQNHTEEFMAKLKGKGTAIDECQLAPRLFPALKHRVLKRKAPGQFLLSGSVRFSSRKAIRESLTGRLTSIELFPLVLTEITQECLSQSIPQLLDAKNVESYVSAIHGVPASLKKARLRAYKEYLNKGGLPGVCFVREEHIRFRMMEDILKTQLDRDLRLVLKTPLALTELVAFCSALADQGLNPLKSPTLQKDLGLDHRTVKRLLSALEAIYLIRRFPIEGGGSKGEMILFEDQLEHESLVQDGLDFENSRIGLIYRNIRAQFEYKLGYTPKYFSFLTRGGARIPLALKTSNGVVGFLAVKKAEQIDRSMNASIESFLSHYEKARIVIMAEEESTPVALGSRVVLLPPHVLFF